MRFPHLAIFYTLASTSTCVSIVSSSFDDGAKKTWNYLGCYSDAPSHRTLASEQRVPGGSKSMTQEVCQEACLAKRFVFSGTEYGGECWCGNSIGNSGTPVTDDESKCNMACKGNEKQRCGGSAFLSIYHHTSLEDKKPIPTPIPTPIKGKRGLAYNNDNPDESAIYANMFKEYPKVTWAYDWGIPSYGLDLSHFEFVPMLWGRPWGEDDDWFKRWKAVVTKPTTKTVLGFNEPDLTYPESCNLNPVDASEAWKKFIRPYQNNVVVGTPNVLWNNDRSWTSGGDYNSRTWLSLFMEKCTNCRFDYGAIHYYSECKPSTGHDAVEWFKGNVTDAWETLKMPVWVTEFQCTGTEAQQVEFIKKVLPWLDAQDWLDRYAYFGVFPEFLIDKTGSRLSGLGEVYASL